MMKRTKKLLISHKNDVLVSSFTNQEKKNGGIQARFDFLKLFLRAGFWPILYENQRKCVKIGLILTIFSLKVTKKN